MGRTRSRVSVEQRRAAEAALHCELERIVASGEYAEWFAKMSAFHSYSSTNTLWILAQRPEATRVASDRTWQQVGRQVRKGETGIMVFRPKPFWVDPSTGDRVVPTRWRAPWRRLQLRMSFEAGYVFDVAQTHGEPLPELARPLPEDAPWALADHLGSYCYDNGITTEIRDLPPGVTGYYERDADRIVENGDSRTHLATVVHQLAHREDPGLIAAYLAGDHSYYRHDKADCEAVAEGVAHVVSARFGYDLTAHSDGYIAGWIEGDVDRFKQLHTRVWSVAAQLVPPDRLDKMLTAARRQVIADSLRQSGRSR